MNRQERRELSAQARKLIQYPVKRIQFPGGESRKSVRLVLEDGGSVIATRRRTSKRGDLEVAVMRGLHAHGGKVPEVIAYDGKLLIQQDLGDFRLSQALNVREPEVPPEQLLSEAIGSMAAIHRAAAKAGLASGVPSIGFAESWIERLAAQPAKLGESIGIPVPDYDQAATASLLRVRTPAFVKWDSRPGNALVASDRAVWWIDWEHCGARNSIDDLVWLMGDEFVPGGHEVANGLLDRHVEDFRGEMTADEARSYFRTMAALHSCVRLELILRRRRKSGRWWRMKDCLAGDRVGVTKRCARRLLTRSGGWVADEPSVSPLGTWFADVREMVDTLP